MVEPYARLMHRVGPLACGQMMADLLVEPVPETEVLGAHFRLPDGSTPKETDEVVCGSCGQPLDDWLGRVGSPGFERDKNGEIDV